MRLALDTNILVSAEGVDGAERRAAAQDLLLRLPPEAVVLPVQVLGELFAVLVRKARWPAAKARMAVGDWQATYDYVETSWTVLSDGMQLADQHRLAPWDAIVLAAAAMGGCNYLLSEDMHNGFAWRGTTIVNPFAADQLPRPLAALFGRVMP